MLVAPAAPITNENAGVFFISFIRKGKVFACGWKCQAPQGPERRYRRALTSLSFSITSPKPFWSDFVWLGDRKHNSTARKRRVMSCNLSQNNLIQTRAFLSVLEFFADTGAENRDLKLAGNLIKSSKGFWWLSSLSDMYAIYIAIVFYNYHESPLITDY